MTTPLSSISIKSLPSPYSLHQSSPCPTRDLIALTSSVPSTSQQKLTLIRTTGNADTVWDWTPIPPAPVTVGGGVGFGAGRFGMAKGKAKVTPGLEGDIKGVCWDPLGNYIALGLSSSSTATTTSSSTSTSSFTLLSVHTGKSPLPPIPLPPSCTSPLSSLAWHALSPSLSTSPPITSFTLSLISRLPTIPKPDSTSSSTASKDAGPGGTTPSAAGPFGGAKNLAMMRERDKDKDQMGREIDFDVAGGRAFPTLLPKEEEGVDADESRAIGDLGATTSDSSVLVIGDESGAAHLYWGGSVYLGSLDLSGESSQPPRKVIHSLPIPTSSAATPNATPTLSLSFLLTSTSPTSPAPALAPAPAPTPHLVQSTANLHLPPTLQLFSQQATILRDHLLIACTALNKVKKSWEESRRLGKVWLTRLGELAKNHAHPHPPLSLLLSLLITGRSSTAVSDLLSSKMTSKLLLKWETTTTDSLADLKKALFVMVTPSLERVVVALDEIRAWRDWKEKFASFKLDQDSRQWIDRTMLVAKEIIRQSDTLELLVLEEERCFQSFSFWLKYELDKVAQQEGSDVRPLARFQPIPVAHYIRHCLPESVISPYLAFGSASTPLEQNLELKDCESWYNALSVDETTTTVGGESLESMMKRMKEELKGQSDLELVQDQLSQHPLLYDDSVSDETSMKVERPPRPSEDGALIGGGGGGAGGGGLGVGASEGMTGPGSTPLGAGIGGGILGSPGQKRGRKRVAPVSLPAMLHLLVKEVERGLNEAIRTVGSQAVVGTEGRLGELKRGAGGEGEQVKCEEGVGLVRERVVGGDTEGVDAALFCAWIGPEEFYISRKTAITPLEIARFHLALPDATRVKILDFDFLDDNELILALGTSPAGTERPKYAIVGVQLSQLTFAETVSPHLPISRSHPISGDFPPEKIALNGRQGRRFISLLSAEGRRLETLDIDPEDDEEVEAGEEDTQMQEE